MYIPMYIRYNMYIYIFNIAQFIAPFVLAKSPYWWKHHQILQHRGGARRTLQKAWVAPGTRSTAVGCWRVRQSFHTMDMRLGRDGRFHFGSDIYCIHIHHSHMSQYYMHIMHLMIQHPQNDLISINSNTWNVPTRGWLEADCFKWRWHGPKLPRKTLLLALLASLPRTVHSHVTLRDSTVKGDSHPVC